MKLKKFPQVYKFLTIQLSEGDPEQDLVTARQLGGALEEDEREVLVKQFESLSQEAELPVDEFGSEVNRWFSGEDEAREWLLGLTASLKSHGSGSGSEGVSQGDLPKDFNGTALNEGDSVQVIKDLKVKGGSSDLKRGTVIKKIHLVGEPDVIECRVNGSTLVLKTCFLKKA
jgi:protein PhnA